jgi:uncharacterized LabA/DUF88 family protein
MTEATSDKAPNSPKAVPIASSQLQPRPSWQARSQTGAPVIPGERGRVAVFIDGLSLFYGAKHLGIEIDYKQLLRYFAHDGRLLHAFFYAGVDEELERSRQQGFLTWMRHHGYRVVTKSVQHFPDGNKKLDIDVEIAVDMMKLSRHCDTMVLVSSNDTLTYAVQRVSERGVRVELLGLNSNTSYELLNLVDVYRDLASIQDEVRLLPRHDGPQPTHKPSAH